MSKNEAENFCRSLMDILGIKEKIDPSLKDIFDKYPRPKSPPEPIKPVLPKSPWPQNHWDEGYWRKDYYPWDQPPIITCKF